LEKRKTEFRVGGDFGGELTILSQGRMCWCRIEMAVGPDWAGWDRIGTRWSTRVR